MKEIKLRDYKFELYIEEQTILSSIKKIGEQIKRDFEGKNPLFVCVMNGSFVFASELFMTINEGYDVAFARYSSYSGTSSTMELKEHMPVSMPVEGRTVILIEDLIDTGYTMKCVKERFYELGAKEVFIAAMLQKPKALKCDVTTDYVCLEIDNEFIVGHGLDYDNMGRMYRDIYKIKSLDN